MFKKVKTNIPFVEVLTQMPHYAKFMRDILSKKRKFDEYGVVNLSVTCNVVIQKNHWKCRILAASPFPVS